ncbi:MBL fold metallo-hydrolase [Alteromonas sp. 009811495]|uniref:MBL fold metallo-hydrolase n=1 Tax=Alteromonas sp. 009811495 TaxID=3002962 RepID=UPI00237DA7F1|nr:MBL fold metallo-hydrolase [Alteromonas sp. 009811495]WDT86912.1 MBL fold metallo-hydrolase [Alteromonas sp. 009811495]
MALIITLFFCFGCQPDITRLENSQFKRSGSKYQNIYVSKYQGKGPHNKYDEMEFLLPEEKKKVEKSIVGFAYSGFDKTVGFRFDDMLFPNIDIDATQVNRVTWLGHASFLIQLGNGDALVTDPVFEEFDGFGWLGSILDDSLKRLGPAPIKAEQLAFVSGVAISHNHYDHLNSSSLDGFNDGTRLYLPLDNADDVNFNKGSIIEMDWYTKTSHNATTIHFLPANHMSNRSFSDIDESLWGSWLFDDGVTRIYFAGDSGYSPIFKDIAQHIGNIDICLMPIVAYPGPARYMHMSPEDAVKAGQDLGCKLFIPWGYGTWSLGYEHVNEPLRRLAKVVEDVQPDFIIQPLKIGEHVDFVEQFTGVRN